MRALHSVALFVSVGALGSACDRSAATSGHAATVAAPSVTPLAATGMPVSATPLATASAETTASPTSTTPSPMAAKREPREQRVFDVVKERTGEYPTSATQVGKLEAPCRGTRYRVFIYRVEPPAANGAPVYVTSGVEDVRGALGDFQTIHTLGLITAPTKTSTIDEVKRVVENELWYGYGDCWARK